MQKKRIYAGIGSRDTPEAICREMTQIAEYLDGRGFTLRSGGARGADDAFERGAGNREIYLPENTFNGRRADRGNCIDASRLPNWIDALALAERHHPNWAAVMRSRNAPSLMGRNAYQILGADLKTPVNFVVCWAENTQFDGQGQICDVDGGTGLAVRLAYAHQIPVYNLDIPEHRMRILGAIPDPKTQKNGTRIKS